MKKRDGRNYFILFLAFLLLLPIVASSASAGIGIAREYLPDNILKLRAGESEIYSVSLQNSGSSEVSLSFSVESTDDIVQIVSPKRVYTIPPKSNERIYLKVDVPKNAEVGQEYTVKLYTGGVEAEREGQVALKTGAGTSFKVQVISPEEDPTQIARTGDYKEPLIIPWYFWIIVALAAAAIISYIYYKKVLLR